MTQPQSEPIAHLAIPAKDLKMLREDLCALMRVVPDVYSGKNYRLQQLLKEIDHHRPLGSNGKHGTLHTPTCGCEKDGN